MLGNKYLAIITGILLSLVLIYNIKFFSSKAKPGQVPSGRKIVTAPPSVHEVAKVSGRVLEKEDRNKWKRDPFSLKAEIKKQETKDVRQDIHLMGIIRREGRGLALINGGVYRVNDRIGNAVLKEIKKHSIVIAANGKDEEITFDDYTVLKEKTK